MSFSRTLTIFVGSFLMLSAFAVIAHAEPASGDKIRGSVIGNTVQGTMDASGAYSEFYQEDGVIVGPDYTGQWTIEGDEMCFQYDESPADCWMVEIDGDEVSWIKDGSVQGRGTILTGNQLP